MSVDYLLHESSVGYAIFKVSLPPDAVGNRLKEVQQKSQDLSNFGKCVELVSFAPFQGAAEALENINDISEGILSDTLKALVEQNLPKAGKKHRTTLGVVDKALAASIKNEFPYIDCETSETSEVVGDLLRGLRQFGPKLLKQLQDGDIDRAQLGLGHAFSRAKVKFSVQKNDNHIMQAIATLDQLDKAVNTFCMRVREWYSWHFPELIKIVPENHTYAQLVLFIGDKTNLSEDQLHDLAAIVNDDESIARSIIDAARVSMGRDVSEVDFENIRDFAKRAVELGVFRKNLSNYLVHKMNTVAPNVTALLGETIGARLISKAGSLTNLSKLPASTIQILGAEKALFRALKTKGNTPKYGLIYHSSFIGRAGQKNKGRISRFLANKTSIASRIDNFSETPTSAFGLALRKQVEQRLDFYATGAAPEKNEVVMKSAMDAVLSDLNVADPTSEDVDMDDANPETPKKEKKEKKKDKKARKSDAQGLPILTVKSPAADEESEKKSKKEKKEKRKSDVNGLEDEKAEKKKRKNDEGEDGKKKKKKSKDTA